jgi:hypothetical protein
MLQHAFKEWAVICKALAEGRQSLILRKGGIAETAGEFQVEHTRFWLYPTFLHEHRQKVKPEAVPLLEQVEAEHTSKGTVHLSHFAEASGVYHIHSLPAALILNHLHLWSEETVRAKFVYRRPGLYVLPVRVYKAAESFEIPETPYYAGCKSWVELERALPTEGAMPVLDDRAFGDLEHNLQVLLRPTALA